MKDSVAGQPGLGNVVEVTERLSNSVATPNSKVPSKADPLTKKTAPDALYRRVQELSQACERGSIVDNEKVNAIKAALANGTYHVDAERIAAKLLEMETELDLATRTPDK